MDMVMEKHGHDTGKHGYDDQNMTMIRPKYGHDMGKHGHDTGKTWT